MNGEWYSSFLAASQQLGGELAVYAPRLLAALLILVIGGAIARFLKSLVVRLIETLSVSKAIKNTPVEHFFKEGGVTNRVEDVLGMVFYWLVMLVVLHTAVSVLGLTSLSLLFERVLSYLPHILSAVLVLFFGLLLAGFVESLVKGSIRSIDGHSGRMLGKLSSYLVMAITVLVAISELGIARDFILILFVGFVTTISLGFGLALGLGAKDLVRSVLDQWYEKLRKDTQE